MRRGFECITKRVVWKLGAKRIIGIQIDRRLRDVLLDLEYVLQRGIARCAFAARQFGLAQELLGIGQRQRARAAAGERPHFARSYDDAVRRKRSRHRRIRKCARQPAVAQVFGAFRRRVPDFDRAEMRQIGARIADALDHGQLTALP